MKSCLIAAVAALALAGPALADQCAWLDKAQSAELQKLIDAKFNGARGFIRRNIGRFEATPLTRVRGASFCASCCANVKVAACAVTGARRVCQALDSACPATKIMTGVGRDCINSTAARAHKTAYATKENRVPMFKSPIKRTFIGIRKCRLFFCNPIRYFSRNMHEHIEPPVSGTNLTEHARHIHLICNVACQRQCQRPELTQFRDHLRALRIILHIMHDDIRARHRQLQRDGAPDAVRAVGYEHDLFRKTVIIRRRHSAARIKDKG